MTHESCGPSKVAIGKCRLTKLYHVRMLLKRGMGNGEWGMGNGEWGMGNGELKMGNGKSKMGN